MVSSLLGNRQELPLAGQVTIMRQQSRVPGRQTRLLVDSSQQCAIALVGAFALSAFGGSICKLKLCSSIATVLENSSNAAN